MPSASQDTTNWADVQRRAPGISTDALSVTLGGRYTDDQKDATIYAHPTTSAVSVIPNASSCRLCATNTDVTPCP